MDLTDALRAANAVLAVIALGMLAWRAWHRWRHYASRLRLLVLSLAAFLAVVAEGSIESIILQTEGGPREWFTTAGCIWTIWALSLTDERLEQ